MDIETQAQGERHGMRKQRLGLHSHKPNNTRDCLQTAEPEGAGKDSLLKALGQQGQHVGPSKRKEV